jgi:hypothetical protein
MELALAFEMHGICLGTTGSNWSVEYQIGPIKVRFMRGRLKTKTLRSEKRPSAQRFSGSSIVI